jgi:hypothetical protein
MGRSTRTTDLVQHDTSLADGALAELDAALAANQEARAGFHAKLTPAQRQAWKRDCEKRATPPPEVIESSRRARARWLTAGLLQQARQRIPAVSTGAQRAPAAPRTRREGSSSRTSSADPGGDDPPAPSSPFEPLPPTARCRGQLPLWFEPRIGGRR